MSFTLKIMNSNDFLRFGLFDIEDFREYVKQPYPEKIDQIVQEFDDVHIMHILKKMEGLDADEELNLKLRNFKIQCETALVDELIKRTHPESKFKM